MKVTAMSNLDVLKLWLCLKFIDPRGHTEVCHCPGNIVRAETGSGMVNLGHRGALQYSAGVTEKAAVGCLKVIGAFHL